VLSKNDDEKKKEKNTSGTVVKKELVSDVRIKSEEDMKREVGRSIGCTGDDHKDGTKKDDGEVVAMDESTDATTTDKIDGDKRSTTRALDLVFDSLVEVVCLDVCFDAHKRHYLNKFIKHRPRTDVYGNYPKNVSEHFKCHHCQRPVTSVKFAPHLEKCMGKTRSRTKRASDR